MKRYDYERIVRGEQDQFLVHDARRGSPTPHEDRAARAIAVCADRADTERIVNALNLTDVPS